MPTDPKSIIDNLETILAKKRVAQFSEALPKFARDEWLMNYLFETAKRQAGEIEKLDSRILLNLIDTMKGVVLAAYDVPDPTVLGSFYRNAIQAISKNALPAGLKDFDAIRTHANQLVPIEPDLITSGLTENAPGSTETAMDPNTRNTVSAPKSPFAYQNNTYGALIQTMWNDSDRKYALAQALPEFSKHFTELKAQGIDISRLLQSGYPEVLSAAYGTAKDTPEHLEGALHGISTTLANLNRKEFDVYRRQTLMTLKEFTGQGKVEDLTRITEECSRNVIILRYGIRFTND